MSTLQTLVILSLLGFIFETGAQSPPIESLNSLKNFKQYFWDYFDWSWGYDDLLKNISDPGIVLVSPFPSAILLGNFNENTFNLSSSGLSAFQNISSEIGANAQNYEYLLKSLVQGGVETKSRLYTSDENLLSRNGSTGLEQFGTDIEKADFEEETWASINNFVDESTRETIQVFIPPGGELFSEFYPWTSAIFVNTNYYKSSWTDSWVSLGPQLFYEDKEGTSIPFMEAKGSFKFYSDSNYPAVAIIPLQEGNKSLILIQPQMNVTEFAQSEELKLLMKNEVWKSWNTSTISTLQIPELKIESRFGFRFDIDKGLELLERLEHIVCSNGTNNGTNLEHFMAPIFQSQSLTMSPDYFELTSATASSVNSLEKLEQSIQQLRINSTMAQNTSTVDDVLEIRTNADEGEPEVASDKIRFNKPFIMFLHDEQLGPMHFTLVNSFTNFRQNGILQQISNSPEDFLIYILLVINGSGSRSEPIFECK